MTREPRYFTPDWRLVDVDGVRCVASDDDLVACEWGRR